MLRVGALLYVAGCALAFLLATPLGGTAGRLAALVTGPLVLTLLLARHRAGALPAWSRHPAALAALALATVLAAGWQWGSARLDVRDAVAQERSTRGGYFAPLVAEIQRRSSTPVRVEIPFTLMHYEALWVAREVPLARGWLRQIDRAHNPLFYDGRLTGARYAGWLRDTTWLGRARLGPARPLRPRRGAHHPLRAAVPARGMAVAGLAAVPRRGIAWVASGPWWWPARTPTDSSCTPTGRGASWSGVRHTRYWRVRSGAACVTRAPDGWTELRVARPGRIEVKARVGSLLRLGKQPQCP